MTFPVLQVDTPDRNNRTYPRVVMEWALAEAQEKVAKRTLLGRLGGELGLELGLRGASHLVTNLSLQGDTVTAEIEVLDTAPGRMLRMLLKEAVGISFEMTGLAELNGNTVESFSLLSVDAVCSPAPVGSALIHTAPGAGPYETPQERPNRRFNFD
jgi:hypothetical protein